MKKAGFTLVELSIVLLIIGLIIGGVLVGRDLIAASEVRAQISQIEKYRTAVHAFRLKYNSIPGDMSAEMAAAGGFTARAGTVGRGDSSGIINGYCYGCGMGTQFNPWNQGGEVVLFWRDLSQANLIDGSFNTATDTSYSAGTPDAVALYVPRGKLSGTSVFIYSGSNYGGVANTSFFALANLGGLSDSFPPYANYTLTVNQAYAIDSKIDDGMPVTKKVRAAMAAYPTAPNLSGVAGAGWSPNAATPSSSTCLDSTSYQYSVGQNNGNSQVCGLSFNF